MGQLLEPIVLRYPFACRAVKEGHGSAWGFVSAVDGKLLFEGKNDILFEVDDVITLEAFEGDGIAIKGQISVVHQAEVYIPLISTKGAIAAAQVFTFDGISFEVKPFTDWTGNPKLGLKKVPFEQNVQLEWKDGESAYRMTSTTELGCELVGDRAATQGSKAKLVLEGHEPIDVVVEFCHSAKSETAVVVSIDEGRIMVGQWRAIRQTLHAE